MSLLDVTNRSGRDPPQERHSYHYRQYRLQLPPFSSFRLFLDVCSLRRCSNLPNPGFPSAHIVVGTVLYMLGTAIEIGSEMQRKRFKKNWRNKGKNYSSGLFSLARHINYSGHVLLRAGYALASSRWLYSGIVACFFRTRFISRAIPVLDDYCQRVRRTFLLGPLPVFLPSCPIVRSIMVGVQAQCATQAVPRLVLARMPRIPNPLDGIYISSDAVRQSQRAEAETQFDCNTISTNRVSFGPNLLKDSLRKHGKTLNRLTQIWT